MLEGIEKLNLNEIPKEFHILFTTDWNNGANSTMNLNERMECCVLYLEYNKWAVKQEIIKNTPTSDSDKPVGFVKD
jgi:hypothetical protein